MAHKIAKVLAKLRESTPLVQCLANYATINGCANILFCFGASPAMKEADVDGIPVISAILKSRDIEGAARELFNAWRRI
jgi:hydroxyethylthiazole kinase-like sugar kinase family protein